MKKFLSLLMMTLLCTAAWAGEVTDELTYAGIGVTGTSYQDWTGKSFTSDAVYAGQSAGGSESIQLRSKNSNSGIITTASGGTIKSVTITFNSNTAVGNTVDVYGKNTAYSAASDLYGNNQGTKLGSIVNGTSTSITVDDEYTFIGLRSNSGAVYLDKVEIVWENGASGDELAKPVITFDPLTAYEGDNVTCTITAAAGEIHYTLDGTTPNENSTLYTAAFTVKATTTVKAVAVEGEILSEVAEKTITFKPTVTTLAGLNDYYSGNTALAFNGEAIITYVNGNYCYVKDATGVALLFGYDVFGTAEVGKKITGFKGTAKLYNQLPEVGDVTDVTYATDDPVTVTPTERTIPQITANPVLNEYTVLRGVSITTPSNKNFTITDADENTLQGRDNFSYPDFPAVVDGLTFDVEGFVATYNGTTQFYPTKIEQAAGAPLAISVTPEAGTYTAPVTVTITANYDDAVITYDINGDGDETYTEPFTLNETAEVYVTATRGNETVEWNGTYTINLPEPVEPMGKCQLVTSADDLVAGKRYIIVATVDGATYAMSTTQNTNNRGASAETIATDGTITPSENAQIITLEDGWYFNVGDGYLYAAASDKNYLRTEAEKDDNAKAAITFDEDGTHIVFQGTNTRNVLQFNLNASNNNPLFSCYGSANQSPVMLYKEVEEGTVIYGIELDKPAGTYKGNVTVKATVTPEMPENGTLTYTYVEEGATETPAEQAFPANGVTLTKKGTLNVYLKDGNTTLASTSASYDFTELIGDLDKDGFVTISDVNYLINIILGKIHPND